MTVKKVIVSLLIFFSITGIQIAVEAQQTGKTTAASPVSPVIHAETDWKALQNSSENTTADTFFSKDFPDKEWWAGFKDEHLNAYIEQALLANHQLALAKASIEEARGLARASLARELPTAQFIPSVERLKTSVNQFPTAGGTGGFSLGNLVSKPYNTYSLPVEVTYEVDFFQKNRDKTRAADQQVKASLQDYRTVLISLITNVTGAYFNLIAEDKLLELQKEFIKISEADLSSEKEKLAVGFVSNEKVAIKEGLLADAKATLEENYRLKALYQNQLAILLGRPPETIQDLPRLDLDQVMVPNLVASGIPSTLITRRPDILSAEAKLEASKINIREARKEFLPSFTFTGEWGYSSVLLKNILQKGSFTDFILGGMTQNLFTGGAKIANLKVAKARYKEQLETYQQNILTAFQEVDNALEGLKSHQNAYNDYLNSNTALNKQLGYQQTQLSEGSIAIADLYPVQVQVIQSQEGLVSAKILGLMDRLNLYQALGGGY